jgi:hypothetical protein
MENIDKLTLELLMNKTNYNKYMEKTNPEKHKEQREFHQKIKKFGPRIQHLTRKFLENPNYQINLEMNDMLEGYARTFIKYLEMKDLEKTCCAGGGEYFEKEKDEDILFDPTEMNSDDDGGKADDIENASVIAVGEPSNSCFKYTMDMYTKKKLLKKIV